MLRRLGRLRQAVSDLGGSVACFGGRIDALLDVFYGRGVGHAVRA
jgi:hypothetical protein